MEPTDADRAENARPRRRRRAIVEEVRGVTAEHTAVARHFSELHDHFLLLHG